MSRRRAGRHLSVVLATVLAATAALVGVSSPASADPQISLSAGGIDHAVVGEPFTIRWDSTDVTQLVASGNGWTTPGPVALDGSQTVTPTSTDDLTFTLTGDPGTQDFTITVVVTVEADGAVTAAPVTFPDACTVVIPDVEGVDYVVDLDPQDPDEVDVLDPGRYPLALFAMDDLTEVGAEAADGYVLAGDSPTSFPLPDAEGCPEQADERADLVSTTAQCRRVVFTNVSDGPVLAVYGANRLDRDADVDGQLELRPGDSRTVSTARTLLSFAAIDTSSFVDDPLDEGPIDPIRYEEGTVQARLACADHPTVAPAAGR